MTSTTRRANSFFALTLALALLGACTPKDQADLKNVGASTAAIAQDNAKTLGAKIDQGVDKALIVGAAAAHAAGDALDDTAITAETKTSFAKDPELKSALIDVTTTHGRVSLSGSVPNIVSRQRAIDTARSSKGVKSVDSQLVIGAKPAEEY